MFKMFFKRKAAEPKVKNKTAAQPVQQMNSLTQMAEAINAAEVREQSQQLRKLAEKIDNNEWSAAEAYQLLKGDAQLMVAIEFDLATSDISEDQWQSLVMSGFSAKIKKAAAEHIVSESLLQSLVKQTRGKDKAVYRILQAKLDAIADQKKQQQAALDKQAAILESFEKLATSSFEPMYEAKFKGLLDQWQAQSAIEPDKLARFETLAAEVQARIDEEKQKLEEPAGVIEAVEATEPEPEPEPEPVVEVNVGEEIRVGLLNELQEALAAALKQAQLNSEVTNELQQHLLDIQHRWRESESTHKASDEHTETLHQLSTIIDATLPRFVQLIETHESIEGLVSWLTEGSPEAIKSADEIATMINQLLKPVKSGPIPAFDPIHQALAAVKKRQAELQAKEAEQVRAIRGQLRRCMAAVTDGHLRRASGLFHGAEDMLNEFNLKAHMGVKKQYDETLEALEKLRDWQAFAVVPKKEALIKRMESLIDQHIDPEARSSAIKEMQDEWKLLSRGLQDKHQELWQTFHELADKAYEPCREYFKEQRHLREVNLQKRKEVVEQLKTYSGLVNWEQPDVKELDQVLQVARNDWRKYSPVDRTANKKTQAEFDALHKQMFDAMRAQQEVHKAAKQAIIEQSRKLLALDDAREATEQAKALQQKWKQAGMIARKDEQAMWKEFRTVCDELFGRRDKETTRIRADESVNLSKAEELINAMEAMVTQGPFISKKGAFNELVESFRQIGALPRGRQQKVLAQFNKVKETFEQSCFKEALIAKDAQWTAVIEWVHKARFSGDDVQTLTDAWQEIKVPQEAKGLFDLVDSWQQSPSEENLAQLHDKTIELEILAEAESPEEDSAQRMAMQVNLLSNGIGASNELSDFHNQVVAWLAIGSVEKSGYETLEARMKQARQIRLG